MMHKYATAIIGIRGYSGLELARILMNHPRAELVAGFATDSSFKLSDYMPEEKAAAVPVLALKELAAMAPKLNTVFLATPAEVSAELAPKLLDAGVHVIDLSGAFRLAPALYPQWYGFEHPCPELYKTAEYGLVPWAPPSAKKGPRLISNPGCYATSVLLALLPLLKNKLIDPASLVIDAKSGTSGAGRKANEGMLFTEVEGECLPYKIAKHQHFPEICGYVEKFADQSIDPHFSTSLINVRRGIISSIYARLNKGVTEVQVADAYRHAYKGYPMIKFGSDVSLSLKRVVGSARAHINYKADGEKLYVFSLIDNLLKGAAGQAVENFNRLGDLPAETALAHMEGVL